MCINVYCGNSFGKRATLRAAKIRTNRMAKRMAANNLRQQQVLQRCTICNKLLYKLF